MASRPMKGKFIIDFPEEKLSALEFCMKEKGGDLEEATAEFLQSLYEKHVPKIMKSYFEQSGDAPPSRRGGAALPPQGENRDLD